MKLQLGKSYGRPKSVLSTLLLFLVLTASGFTFLGLAKLVYFGSDINFAYLLIPWISALLLSGVKPWRNPNPYCSYSKAKTRDSLFRLYGWVTGLASAYLCYHGVFNTLANQLNNHHLESLVLPCASFSAIFVGLLMGGGLHILPNCLHKARLSGRLAADSVQETLSLGGAWLIVILLYLAYENGWLIIESEPRQWLQTLTNLSAFFVVSLVSSAVFASLRLLLTPVIPFTLSIDWSASGLPTFSKIRVQALSPTVWLVFDRLLNPSDTKIINQIASQWPYAPISVVAESGGKLLGEHLYLADQQKRLKALFPQQQTDLVDWLRVLPAQQSWNGLEYRELYLSYELIPVVVNELKKAQDTVLLVNTENIARWQGLLPVSTQVLTWEAEAELIAGYRTRKIKKEKEAKVFGICVNFANCSKANSREKIPLNIGNLLSPICPKCGALISLHNPTNGNKRAFTFATICSFIIVSILTMRFASNSLETTKPLSDSTPKLASNVPDNLDPTNCQLKATKKPAEPNWYAVIEIGSKGIKSIAVKIESSQGKLIPAKFDDCSGIDKDNGCQTQNVTPLMEASIPKVVEAVCENINKFYEEYGNIPIYVVGSSSMAAVSNRGKLEKAINKAIPIKEGIHLPIDFVNAKQEQFRLFKGIHVPQFPTYRYCQSIIADIGSGNIKGGYLNNCSSKSEKISIENFETFEIEQFGTVAFSKNTKEAINANKKFTNFISAASATRKELEKKLYDQLETHPVLLNGEKRVFLTGGAVWALNNLLCLDCPQYRYRSITDDQDEYTVIKPSDIEEFYRFITQQPELVCDADHNPYFEISLDSGPTLTLEPSRLEDQKRKIEKVCKVFGSSTDLVSAAEILRAIVKEFQINDQRHIFFMQNNLYTWSRQYLIEKIQKSKSAVK